MRDAEQAIEKVLAGLREADAPQGMEGRILRAMEERAEERTSRGPWRVWMKKPGYAAITAGGVIVAGVLLVVMVMPSGRKAAQVEPGRRVLNVTAALRGLDATADDKGSGVLQRLKPHAQSQGYGTAEAAPLGNADLSKRGSSRTSLSEIGSSLSAPANPNEAAIVTGRGVGIFQDGRSADGIPDYDALAISEMLAPSKPAPPLPLTNQEKLLAKVVHKGSPDALATLQPDVRAKQMEISKAEFQDFFDPPQAKDNE